MKYILVIIVFSAALDLFAQFEPGSKQVALSHSDITSDNNVFSIFSNPAGSGKLKNIQIGFFYSPSLFGVEELSSTSLAFTQPSDLGNFSLGIMSFGFKLFRENKFVLGYSIPLNNDFLVGLGFSYNFIRIERYGTNSQINLSLGGIFNISKHFLIGFSIHNLLRNSQTPIELPLLYNLGVTYRIIDKGSINFAFSKEIYFPLSPRFGVEYNPLDFLSFQIGVKDKPVAYSCGIGIAYKFLRVGYAFDLHQVLGFTHQGDLIITL